jgi:hypothetical protein
MEELISTEQHLSVADLCLTKIYALPSESCSQSVLFMSAFVVTLKRKLQNVL